jgi:hypothetical protein
MVVTLGRLMNQVDDISLMGTEWLPLGPVALFNLGLVGHLCLVISWVVLLKVKKDTADKLTYQRTLLFTLLATLFLVLYSRHWRMGEYYGPLSAVSLGFALALIPHRDRRWRAIIAAAVLVATLLHQWLKHPDIVPTVEGYDGHCRFLDSNASAGDLVFNLPWPAFSHLYGCQPQLRFIAGFDGLMLMHGSPEVFRIWYLLYSGQLDRLTPADVISTLEKTESRFIFAAPAHYSTTQWLLDNIPTARASYADQSGYLISLARPGEKP